MTDKFVFDYIAKKEVENMDFIKYSYYELKIKNNLSDDDIYRFLTINKAYFENHGYKVYLMGEIYKYNGIEKCVQNNEYMIAFKEN